MENNEPITNEEQSMPSAESNNTANRPSNLRSRWKRKNGPGGAKKSTASTLGEIDPSTLPLESKSASLTEETASTATDQPQEKPAPRPQQTRRPREHTKEREHNRERTPKTEYYEPKSRSSDNAEGRPTAQKSRPRSDENSRSHSHAPRAQVTPATYKPASLPKDTLWQRIKEFFTNLVGGKSSMFEIKSEPYKHRDQGYKKRSNYSRSSRSNQQRSRANKESL